MIQARRSARESGWLNLRRGHSGKRVSEDLRLLHRPAVHSPCVIGTRGALSQTALLPFQARKQGRKRSGWVDRRAAVPPVLLRAPAAPVASLDLLSLGSLHAPLAMRSRFCADHDSRAMAPVATQRHESARLVAVLGLLLRAPSSSCCVLSSPSSRWTARTLGVLPPGDRCCSAPSIGRSGRWKAALESSDQPQISDRVRRLNMWMLCLCVLDSLRSHVTATDLTHGLTAPWREQSAQRIPTHRTLAAASDRACRERTAS